MENNKSEKAEKLFNTISTVAAIPTERKEPGSTTQAAGEDKPSNVYKAPGKETEKPEETETQPTTTKQGLTEEEIEATGKTGAFLIADTIEMLFTFGERMKFIYSFNSSEKERILLLDEKPQTEYTEKDHRLNNKFLALTKKHEKIRKDIPLKPRDIESLQMAFSEHARITGKDLNPQLILYSTIAKVLIGKSMDILM